MEKPDVDYIDGLSPAISIDQKTTSKNPPSGEHTAAKSLPRIMYRSQPHSSLKSFSTPNATGDNTHAG